MKITTTPLLLLLFASLAGAEPDAHVLHVASERQTSLALHYPYFPQFARVGFGTAERPWHPWFGTPELRVLVHVPGFEPGDDVRIRPEMILGTGFGGRRWESGTEALRSFDTDGNGIVERDEMRDLYVWIDFTSSGTLAPRSDALLPTAKDYAGFDLRQSPRGVEGDAVAGRLTPFSVMKKRGTRSHLLELPIQGAFATRDRAYLSFAKLDADARLDTAHPLSGEWEWKIKNAAAWEDGFRPWGDEAGGRLLLAVQGDTVRGLVRYEGPHRDVINLPLRGTIEGNAVRWTSVSPLGLTRSDVELVNEFGHRVLRGRAHSSRNGRVRTWSWEALHVEPLE